MGRGTAGGRGSCPCPTSAHGSNEAGSGSRSSRTNARSSGTPIEQDAPDFHLREELGRRQPVFLGQDDRAERVVFGASREDQLLQPPNRDETVGRVAPTGRSDWIAACLARHSLASRDAERGCKPPESCPAPAPSCEIASRCETPPPRACSHS